MNTWILLILAASLGSLISLVGGLYLLYGKRGVGAIQRLAVPFAAGALLAAAFLDLLPEAVELIEGDERSVLAAALVGLLSFFLLERSLSWFHHHHEEAHEKETSNNGIRRTASLIVIGDTLHNLIDGIAIGAAFIVSPAAGLITTVAVAAHEVPQEIGDFSMLIAKGMKKRNILLVNLLGAVVTVIGALAIYGIGGQLPFAESTLLGVTAGFFIYIAASDIIPTIHAEPSRKRAAIQSGVLIFGVVFVMLAGQAIDQFVESFMSR